MGSHGARRLPFAPFGSSTTIFAIIDAFAVFVAATAVGVPTEIAFAFTLSAITLFRFGSFSRIERSALDELPRIAGASALGTLIVSALGWHPSRIASIALVAVTLTAVVLARSLFNIAIRAMRRKGRGMKRALIIGAGATSAAIARAMREHPELGLTPVGFVDAASDAEVSLPVIGDVSDLPELIERTRAAVVVVGFGVSRDARLAHVLRTSATRLPVFVVPRLFDLGVGSDAGSDLWGFPLTEVRASGPVRISWSVKRAMDVVGAGLGLLIASPVILASVIAVRLSSPGPILFRQMRIGLQGRPFELMKFRTMRVNDDSDTTWSVDNDSRLTLVGKILRASHIDELPQLLNVLRGDMALVGPRPERPFFVEQFRAVHRRYDDRHRVPVGMTGLAQIHGLVGNTSIEDRARFDNRYIERWSIAHDIAIMLRTPASIVKRIFNGDEPDRVIRLDGLETVPLGEVGENAHPIGAGAYANGNGNGAHANGHSNGTGHSNGNGEHADGHHTNGNGLTVKGPNGHANGRANGKAKNSARTTGAKPSRDGSPNGVSASSNGVQPSRDGEAHDARTGGSE